MSELPEALFLPAGDGVFEPTELTRGPWDPGAQHGGPPAALLAHEIEAAAGIAGGQVLRLAYDILKPVPLAPLRLATSVVRGGRRVELLEASLRTVADDTLVMRCAAWRVRAERIELPAGLDEPVGEPPPAPDTLPLIEELIGWSGPTAYKDALDWKLWHGSFHEPGPAGVWSRLRVPLVAGAGPASPLEHLLTMADAASGFGAALPWKGWSFMNLELGLHLERPPAGEWLAMDCRTVLGPLGAGQAESVLHDTSGRCGRSTAALLIMQR